MLIGAIRLARAQGRFERRRWTALARGVPWVVPVVPAVGALWTAGSVQTTVAAAGLATGYLAGHVVGGRAAALDPFLSLRAPSRPALRAARWILRTPWFAWAGTCLAVFAARAFPDGGAAAIALAAVVPLLQAALSGLYRILRGRDAPPLPTLAASLAVAGTVPAGAVWAALEPAVRGPLAVAAYAAALGLILLGVALARTGEAAAAEDPEPETVPRTVAAKVGRLPSSHRGRTGVRGAALARARARLRLPPFPVLLSALPRRFARLVIALVGPFLTLLLGWIDEAEAAGMVVVLAAFVSPSHLALAPHPRLWLLGESSRRVANARLRSLLFTAALPTLAVAAAATWIAGPTPVRVDALAGLAALFLFRAGLPHLRRHALGLAAITAVLLTAYVGLYLATAAVALASGLFGLVRYSLTDPSGDLRWKSREFPYPPDSF